MPPKNKGGLPDGTFAINQEDKKEIVALGRDLRKFVLEYAAKKPNFHLKIVAGAFQYFMDIETQKKNLIGDDVALSQRVLAAEGLGTRINEPFNDPEPTPPTIEEQIKFHEEQIASLKKKDPEVDAASIAPKPAEAPAQA